MPSWSKDGTKLVFDFRSGGALELWMRDVKEVTEKAPEEVGSAFGLWYTTYAGKLILCYGFDTNGIARTLSLLRGQIAPYNLTRGYGWLHKELTPEGAASFYLSAIRLLQVENQIRRTVPSELINSFTPGSTLGLNISLEKGFMQNSLAFL